MTERRLSAWSHAWTLVGLLALAVAVVTLTRFMPYWLGQTHPLTAYLWNFTPIVALLLFGVALFPRWWVGAGFLLPLVAMSVSDGVLWLAGYTVGDSLWGRVEIYCTFVVIGGLGFWLRYRRKVWDVVAVSLVSSILFFLITNFAVWVGSNPMKLPPYGYPKTFIGLLECYWYALPFFRNEAFGTLFYCGMLFGGYALAERWLARKQVPVPVTVQSGSH